MENQNEVRSIIRSALEKIYNLTGLAVSEVKGEWIHVGTVGNPFQHVLTYIEFDKVYVDVVKKETND